MAKKILFISETPTHPQNAGNRVRIFNMASFLIDQGFEVYFLYSLQQAFDERKMKEFWKEKLYTVKYSKPALVKENKYLSKVKHIFNKNLKYQVKTDFEYNLLLDDYIKDLIKRISFDIVIVEYIFLSKAFLNFGNNVLKIIDTHDVMTNRHKMFLNSGKEPSWYSTTSKEEKNGLEKADIIIAIQEQEKKYFNKITKKKVVNVGHLLGVYEPINVATARNKLLFVGSINPINQYGITHFIESIFPFIRRNCDDIELIVAGKICNELTEMEGIRLLGEVEDMKTAYDLADIVINPLIFGTGLKIKMIEALGYSKAVISSNVGAEGLEDGAGESFILANTPEEYVKEINKILSNSEVYKNLCNNAKEYAANWNQKNANQLLDLIN